MFNPNPRVQAVPISQRHACYVVDDALTDPQHWVRLARRYRDHFEDSPRNAFPGPELGFAPETIEALTAFFNAHVRGLLGGRRTLRSTARLSLVTRRPEELQPWQWSCHTDRLDTPPEQTIAASVIYLFRDPALGGTAFYAPRRPLQDIAALVRASRDMPPAEFSAHYGIAPAYMTDSNQWFTKLASIPARWNRAIFYPGMVLHSGEITHPDRLTADPETGRLTINAFFTCTRRALR